MYETIKFDISGRRAQIKINRPPANVPNIQTKEEICSALDAIKLIEDDLGLLVICAEGEKAFSAGVDVADHTKDKFEKTVVGACPNCGASVTPGAKFCAECGQPIKREKFCAECGARLEGSPKFCPECGAKI